MNESIFAKIINGDIPCHKVYEDEHTFAFLDIHPVHEGHVLVVPKKQVEFVWDLDGDQYKAVMETSQRIARRLRVVLPYSYVSARIVGVDVPHAHVHLIPFDSAEELQYEPDQAAEVDHDMLKKVAQKIAF